MRDTEKLAQSPRCAHTFGQIVYVSTVFIRERYFLIKASISRKLYHIGVNNDVSWSQLSFENNSF